MVLRLALFFILSSLALVLLFKYVDPPTTWTILLDENGAERAWVPINSIAPDMMAAVIAAEDSKFCSHSGFDREAIEQAIEERASGKRKRGASTISQQTAKNVFLWQGGGFVRKGLEAWFTILIENIWGKKRIMEVYLNVAETGIGTYGVEAGAQRYFDVSASALSRIQAARIAAALPSPKTRAVSNPSGFTRRYGNTIAARISVVRRDNLNACVM
ncbi:monofunctional biosynthetic peptidoglycan transglycosylase [Parasphingorhabdus sp. DH2-15]|uniref:monofunctional biosynthetic peptidoglycan transglycosylase n=1 Tax=Parasphingorhabdus sp. DH2-15 TaxID=3444112 RepID=UPI003F686E76